MLAIITTALLALSTPAHAQYVGTCDEGATYDLSYDSHWSNAESLEFIDRYVEVPLPLRTGNLRLTARRVEGVSAQGTPAGVQDESHDTLLFWDGFFDLDEAEQQIVLNHEMAHIWAFNHLCELEDFARIGWTSISREGRSGVPREGATYPARAGETGDLYSASSPQEDFAVSVELYIQDPAGFARSYPERGAWISAYLLPLRGCPQPVFLCDLYRLIDASAAEEAEEYGPHEEDYYRELDEEAEEEGMEERGRDIIF